MQGPFSWSIWSILNCFYFKKDQNLNFIFNEKKVCFNKYPRVSIPDLDFTELSASEKEQLIRQTLLIKRQVLLGDGFPNGFSVWRNERGKTHETNLRAAMASNLLQLAFDSKGRLVGYLAAKPSALGECIAEITDFYVLSSSRGKSNGSPGKYLLSHTLEKLDQLSYQEVFLGTVPEFKCAITLYQMYGFRKRSDLHPSQSGNLVYTKDKMTFEMVRKLSVTSVAEENLKRA